MIFVPRIVVTAAHFTAAASGEIDHGGVVSSLLAQRITHSYGLKYLCRKNTCFCRLSSALLISKYNVHRFTLRGVMILTRTT